MEAHSFLKLVLEFIENKTTGALKVKKDQLEKVLYFKEGKIIYVDSSLRYENLGRILVDKGKLSEDQFTELLNKVKETGKRQGEALVELGFLTPFEVFEALKEQLGKKISNCFLLQDFNYEFEEGSEHLEKVTEIPVNVLRTLLDGVQTVCTHEVLKEEGGFTKEMVPVITDKNKEKLNEIRLKPEEVKLMRLFNGKKTLFEVVRDSNMDHQFILSTVYFLNSIGIISYDTKPEPQIEKAESKFRSARIDDNDETSKDKNVEKEKPVETQQDEKPSQKGEENKKIEEEPVPPEQRDNPLYNLYLKMDKMGHLELFNLGVKFKKENLKKNYDEVIKKYDLDKIDLKYEGQTKETAEKILNRVVTAYTILKNEKMRDEYLKIRAKILEPKSIESDPLVMAEIEMSKAMIFRKKHNLEKTLEHLRKAHELNPNEIDYMISIAEIQMNIHGKGKKPQIPEEVQELLKKAAAADNNNINVFLNLGIYNKLMGNRDKAINFFNKVLSIAPGNPRANAELRLFDIRGDKKPMFSLFAKKPKEDKKSSNGGDEDK